jgi:hypothetical protein
MLSGPFQAKFINPGPLSAQHGTAAFVALANANHIGGNSCGACHENEKAGFIGWFTSAMGADPAPFDLPALASTEAPSMTRLDSKCMRCHTGHMFHQPNVVSAHSCSDCHREHRGPGPMQHPSDAHCLSCHANANTMEASLAFGKIISPAAFDYRPEQGRVIFKTARPARGYTELIHSFSTDHPEFQAVADKLKDPNSLKFNHQLHLTGISLANGRKMSCADCHTPDAAGVYHLKITYDQNCKDCHQLQFDVENPELTLPHGNAAHVRDFLRSLPAQYADFGANRKKITARRDLEAFVQEQMKRIRQEMGSGEEFEQRIFFSNARTAPVSRIDERAETGSARFSGCAYCHTVIASASEVPQVVKPIVPDRWLIRARFAHGKHSKIACNSCHDVEHSRQTADILLPAKQTCATCHSPSGGVANSCSTCHDYHSPGHVKRVGEAKR